MQVSIVRLAPSAHGEGDHAFVPFRIAKAREKGFSAYIDDGSNRWSAVHRRDAAVVFRLALEAGPAHATYHGNAEEGITFRDIATAVGQGLHLPVESVPPQAADDHFDWLSGFVALDCPAFQRVHSRAAGLAAGPRRSAWRSCCGTLFRSLKLSELGVTRRCNKMEH